MHGYSCHLCPIVPICAHDGDNGLRDVPGDRAAASFVIVMLMADSLQIDFVFDRVPAAAGENELVYVPPARNANAPVRIISASNPLAIFLPDRDVWPIDLLLVRGCRPNRLEKNLRGESPVLSLVARQRVVHAKTDTDQGQLRSCSRPPLTPTSAGIGERSSRS